MDVTVLLAETGTVHQDGTFSLLRAGIDRIWAKAGPVPFRGVLAIRFSATPSENGNHAFVLVAMDSDGKRISPDLKGSFVTPKEGGSGLVMVNFQVAFPTLGNYEYAVSIDGTEQARWPVKVLAPVAPKSAGSPQP